MMQSYPSHQLMIGVVPVEVTIKPIKHLHLSVVPPDGAVRISAPQGMSPDHVRAYAIGKLGWIRKQQARPRQGRNPLREHLRQQRRIYEVILVPHVSGME
jgi:predicted metal-dependent hydrolase